jgi:predicted metalloenzyme YecM
MIISNYSKFIDKIIAKLNYLGIDTNELTIDHISYQVDSSKDYENKISALKDTVTQLSENIVGGRRVGIFKLNDPIDYETNKISIIEIFEPREGQVVKSDWEHIEFLMNSPLENFMEKYSNIEWDVSVLNREEFPMLILNLGDGLRAKFPRLGVIDELNRLENN